MGPNGVLRLHPPHPEGLETPLDTRMEPFWLLLAAEGCLRHLEIKCKWPKAVSTIPSPAGITFLVILSPLDILNCIKHPVQDLSILHAGCLLWGGLSALYSLSLSLSFFLLSGCNLLSCSVFNCNELLKRWASWWQWMSFDYIISLITGNIFADSGVWMIATAVDVSVDDEE